MVTVYFSFADAYRFLRACFVEAPSYEEAIDEATRQGCNPGGEALGVVLDVRTASFVREQWRNRILTKEELYAYEREMRGNRR
jgi:hypothetical protein